MAYKELNLKNDTYLDQSHMEHIEDGITAAHEQAEANSQALSAQGERVAVLEQTDTDHGSAIEALQERATALEKDAEATMSTLETVQEAVAALPDVNATIQAHNESNAAHSDIRASVSSALAEAKAYADAAIFATTANGGVGEDRIIQILSDTGAVEFASEDGDVLYTDSENRIYVI